MSGRNRNSVRSHNTGRHCSSVARPRSTPHDAEIQYILRLFQQHSESRSCTTCRHPFHTYHVERRRLCDTGLEMAGRLEWLLYDKAEILGEHFDEEIEYGMTSANELLTMICHNNQGVEDAPFGDLRYTETRGIRPHRSHARHHYPGRCFLPQGPVHVPTASHAPRYTPAPVGTILGSAAAEDLAALPGTSPRSSYEYVPAGSTCHRRGHSPRNSNASLYQDPRTSYSGVHLAVPQGADYASDSGSNSSVGSKNVRFAPQVAVREFHSGP